MTLRPTTIRRPSCFPVLVLPPALLLAHFAQAIEVQTTSNTKYLTAYQVFELTFQHTAQYADPTWDVTIDVTFASPGGERIVVGGFFYGSSRLQTPTVREWKDDRGRPRSEATWPCDPADTWKARYAPSELGTWRYAYVFRTRTGESARGSGEFQVVPGRVKHPGWVRIHPDNPYRFVHEDGTPFFPVGWQDGVFDANHNGSAVDAFSMEGPFRQDREAERPQPPPGPLFARGPSMNPQNGDVYFGRHARAGFNLWRFSPHNFSLPVFDIAYDPQAPHPARVRWEQARMVDEMLCMTRKYGIRNFYGIFGFAKVFNDHPDDARAMAKVKRLIKYSVDRWGAYVDFWELLNEQKACDGWYEIMIPYLKSIDPYHKPVATSWERPDLAGIDISAPHWYGREDELASDHVSVSHATTHKKPGKPVVFGEQGNGGGKPELIPQGIGGVWDPGSARRMRVRTWTAFFNEISFVFWETSYAKDGHHMNLWIGPEERQYIHALQDFAYRLDAGIRPVAVPLGGPQAQQVRSYGLRSDRRAAVYLHHTTCQQCAVAASGDKSAHHTWDHQRGAVQDLQVTIDVPQAGHGYWYRPTDAAVLARFDAAAGSGTFTVPDFDVDLALLITPDGPPDIDHDGQPNDGDEDDDNDGCPDAQDAYPLEREEQADVDQDRIGDSLDADIDGDGVADDRNGNGIPDNEEPDWDGDGVPNAGAIPWDAFPRDPKELRDTDGDGIGDNADPDDDGDGYTDEEERRAGTDPLNPLSFPTQPLEQWIQALYDNDPRFREQAARALGQLGAGAATAVAPLTQTLADPVAPVRAAAAESLGKIGPAAKPAVAPLLAALKDRTPIRLDAHVAMVASEALGDLGPGVLPELMAALDSPDLLTCLGSAAALQRMGPQAQEAIPRLIALLASDPNRRIPMIAALQGIGKAAKPAVPALIKTLDSEDFHTQYWACRALGAIGPDAQAAVPKLCELTKSGTASVRRNAAAALGQIGPAIGTAGLDALIAAVGDGIEPVRENAVKALGQLADFAAPAVPTIRAAVAERKIAARVASARALWRITHDADTAVPILIEQLGGLDEPEDAAEALAELGPAAQAAVPALVARLTAQAGSLRALACEALGKIGTAAQPAIPELQKLREDEDAEVRQAADEALVQIRSAVGRINTRGP